MRLSLLDSLTDAGMAGRPNEDAFATSENRAFVIDGATGLGNQQVMAGHGSDARWLAHFARDRFLELSDLPVADIVRETNRRAGEQVREMESGRSLEAWALPVAGFQMISIEEHEIITYGLGDCRLFILSPSDGRIFHTSALKGNPAAERERARAAIEKTGGLAKLASLSLDPSVQRELREARARYNTVDGPLWTLGTAPDAADFVVRETVPFSGEAVGLLCTDGFAALCDQYGLYDMAGLIAATRKRGLASLLDELRHLERILDPDGQAFPRYKVSDDATAVLFEVRI